jgi:hypothetical protein
MTAEYLIWRIFMKIWSWLKPKPKLTIKLDNLRKPLDEETLDTLETGFKNSRGFMVCFEDDTGIKFISWMFDYDAMATVILRLISSDEDLAARLKTQIMTALEDVEVKSDEDSYIA